MADWATISSLATAGGTLVLAVATFSSVRSSNRSARLAEVAFLAQTRPLLLHGRADDPPQKLRWGDAHVERLEGILGVVTPANGEIYLAFAVRNAGAGLAVVHSWQVVPVAPSADFSSTWAAGDPTGILGATVPAPDVSTFRRQARDLYIAAGDVGFWQGAVRGGDDPYRVTVEGALATRDAFAIDVLYGDHEGGQRTISRFSLAPVGDDRWLCAVVRHWHLDRGDARPVD